MAARPRWSDLSKRSRTFIVVGGVAEAGLKTAALIDIKRRPASEYPGPQVAMGRRDRAGQLPRRRPAVLFRVRPPAVAGIRPGRGEAGPTAAADQRGDIPAHSLLTQQAYHLSGDGHDAAVTPGRSLSRRG